MFQVEEEEECKEETDFLSNWWAKFDQKGQQNGEWNCTTCRKVNEKQYQRCISCQTPKPIYDQPKTPQLNVPWKNTANFNYIVAIDFGTEGTAMAINMRNSTGVHSITDWSGSGVSDSKESTGKTKTALLLDQDYQAIAFGNEAWNKYIRIFYSLFCCVFIRNSILRFKNIQTNLFFFKFFFFFFKKKISIA
ncbi:hypothetical protein RFI_35412 [Reticulomyxa filosa]|uniref:RanBP2-type domain-containing protein n=1 Tax=Reticulomyxa filosa TaxID=46433 RepID=X6LK95_RETFI|nr:hypothetical protein RFI_35412 [Reticulomyxa filosa]|eukprot:ETO02024.1 hypothetical protein RFI_35412 [Reticulomyxa filosa]